MKWKVKTKIDNVEILAEDLHPVIIQLLLQRNITDDFEKEKYLTPNYDADLHDPFLFTDMQKVIDRIGRAIKEKEIVGIFGDHDADGISSATILSECLEDLGLKVHVYIPDKITEGHGINEKAIDLFKKEGISLFLSVDCGTSNHHEVDYATSLGMDVIITDHHHAPDQLPQAYAIINPQVKNEKYPFRDLSGTGVAFKVVQALFSVFAPQKTEQLKWLLDVVCVGTIADCVPLIGENRIFVKYGLIVLEKTKRVGYQKLFSVGNILRYSPSISSDIIAFHVAPRINAAGRMTHAKKAYALMREKSEARAEEIAQDIELQNQKRRKIVDEMTRNIEKIVKKDFKDRSFIAIASDEYPVGVIGIAAGRIAEKYHKPTGIFSREGDHLRGSFRSVDGVHIIDILKSCEKYLLKYGGHEKAAGAIMEYEKFDEFADCANNAVKKITKSVKEKNIRYADAVIDFEDITENFLDQLQKLEPFGERNPEPVFFVKGVSISDIRMIGNGQKHLKLKISNEGAMKNIDAIGFNLAQNFMHLTYGDDIDMYVHIQENIWQGQRNVQLNIIDIQ
jgi:single-stranded-DNA-specific exonuclease